jgi:hypothetical protein
VCGSRDAPVGAVFMAMAQCGWVPSVVISGAARGADTHGEAWAEARGIPVERYPADWEKHGRAAGPKRNVEMIKLAEAVVAVWDGYSPGTAHAIKTAESAKLKVFVYHYR